MKKTLILLLMVLIVSVAMLAACGGGTQVKGKYVLTSMEDKIEGKLDKAKLAEAGMSMSIEFLDGGKCKLDMMGMVVDGTFKLEGKNLTITGPDDMKVAGVVEGNKITLEYDAESTVDDKTEKYKQKLVFEKQ